MLVSLHELEKKFGSKTLFDGLSFSIEEREKVGLIGPNGAGKSTLLKLIAGMEPVGGGTITINRGRKLCYVGQGDHLRAEHTVKEALVEFLDIKKTDEIERETKAATVASLLGFDDPDKKVSELSGGWRKRIIIGQAIVQDPDLLLLDEPTNHMDWEAINWLSVFLKNSVPAYLIVTHDRSFLESSTNRIIEINSFFKGGFFSYKGNYSKFLEKKAEYVEMQKQWQASMSNKLRREVEWLRKSPQARTTKSRSRIDAAYELSDQLDDVKERNSAAHNKSSIEFNQGIKASRKLIEISNAGKSYAGKLGEEKVLFQGLSMQLGPRECIGILGLNGSGKSTLLKAIIGSVQLDVGSIELSEGLQVVYFDQKREQLNQKNTLMEFLTGGTSDHVMYRGELMHGAAYARKFLFRVEQFNMRIENLSGGEQARLLLTKLMLREADVLILDEPTNDLDIETLNILESSLSDFQGGILIISHDRFFLEKVSTKFLALEGEGKWNFYPDFHQWEQLALKGHKSEKTQKNDAPIKGKKNQKKKLSYNEQKEWDSMESNIAAAEEALEKEQAKLEDTEVMSDIDKLNACIAVVGELQLKVDTLFERWSFLENKLEQGEP